VVRSDADRRISLLFDVFVANQRLRTLLGQAMSDSGDAAHHSPRLPPQHDRELQKPIEEVRAALHTLDDAATVALTGLLADERASTGGRVTWHGSVLSRSSVTLDGGGC
jgi:hypothetical protein